MNRPTVAIALAILGLVWISVDSHAQDVSVPPVGLVAHNKEGLFPSGQSISVARTRRLGQIGRSRSYPRESLSVSTPAE